MTYAAGSAAGENHHSSSIKKRIELLTLRGPNLSPNQV